MKHNISLIHKRKFIGLLLAFSMTFLLTFSSCSNEGGSSAKLSSSSMPDFQYMFKLLGAQTPTQKSDNGYYNVVSDHIVFTDEKTLKSTPLCNKTDCLHTSEFPDCNAKIENMQNCTDNFQIYDNSIYYLSFVVTDDITEEENKLIRISLDGSKRDDIITLKSKFISDWFLYDGYFYYQSMISTDNSDSESKSGNFYRINLSNNTEEEFIDFSKISGIYDAEGSLRNVYDGYMYVTLSGYKNKDDYEKITNGKDLDTVDSYTTKIARFNLTDGKCQIIDPYKNDYEFVGFSDGKLVGTIIDDKKTQICISNLDGTEPDIVTETNSKYQIFCDDSYLYVYNQSVVDENDDVKKIYVYDKNGNKKSEVTVPDEISDVISAASITFGDDYMWFQMTDSKGIKVLYCIQKSDLMKNGTKLTYKEVYRYE